MASAGDGDLCSVERLKSVDCGAMLSSTFGAGDCGGIGAKMVQS